MLFLNSITDDWWSILIWGLVPSVSYNDLWVSYTSFFGKILLLSLFYVLSYFRKVEVKVKVSCSVVSNSLRPHGLYSLPGSFVHGIFQPRTLEWVAISFPRGSSQPGLEPGSPTLQVDSLQSETPGKPWVQLSLYPWGDSFWDPASLRDTKTQGCSNPLYKMTYCVFLYPTTSPLYIVSRLLIIPNTM